jgi:hypothetical protein
MRFESGRLVQKASEVIKWMIRLYLPRGAMRVGSSTCLRPLLRTRKAKATHLQPVVAEHRGGRKCGTGTSDPSPGHTRLMCLRPRRVRRATHVCALCAPGCSHRTGLSHQV